jgi:hypothetical protein
MIRLQNLRPTFLALCAFAFVTSNIALASVITFEPLAGPTDSSYTGHNEAGFTVAPTTNNWFQALVYGNPIPSIYDGPVTQPSNAGVQVTGGGALFTFNSLDFSSNNGDSAYTIQGFNGAAMAFSQTGALPGTFAPFSFSTLAGANPAVAIDRLLIQVNPGSTVSSVNIDNINLGSAAAPEPGTLMMLGLGLCSAFTLRLFSRRPRSARTEG